MVLHLAGFPRPFQGDEPMMPARCWIAPCFLFQRQSSNSLQQISRAITIRWPLNSHRIFMPQRATIGRDPKSQIRNNDAR